MADVDTYDTGDLECAAGYSRGNLILHRTDKCGKGGRCDASASFRLRVRIFFRCLFRSERFFEPVNNLRTFLISLLPPQDDEILTAFTYTSMNLT